MSCSNVHKSSQYAVRTPLKILSWNVHGIRSKVDDIECMLQTEDPAVAFFSETHLKNNRCGALTSTLPNNRDAQTGKARRWIFCSSDIPGHITDPAAVSTYPGGICATISAHWADRVQRGPIPSSTLLRGYVICLDFKNPGKKKFLRVIGIYLPPYNTRPSCNNTAIREEALKFLSAECTAQRSARATPHKYQLIITGDFNAALYPSDRSSSSDRRPIDIKWQEFTSENHLVPFDPPGPGQARAHTYSHTLPGGHARSSHRIDDFISPNDSAPSTVPSTVATLAKYEGWSDHLPIMLTITDARSLGMHDSLAEPTYDRDSDCGPAPPRIKLPIPPTKLHLFKHQLTALHGNTCASASATIAGICAAIDAVTVTDVQRDLMIKEVDAAFTPIIHAIFSVGMSTCNTTPTGARGTAQADSSFFNRPESAKYKKHMSTMSLCRKALAKARASGPHWATTHVVTRLAKLHPNLAPPPNSAGRHVPQSWIRSVSEVSSTAAQCASALCLQRTRRTETRLSAKFSRLLFSNRRKAYRTLREPEAAPRLTFIRPSPDAEIISDRGQFLHAVADAYSKKVQPRPSLHGEPQTRPDTSAHQAPPIPPMPCSLEAQLSLPPADVLDPFNLRAARDSGAPDSIVHASFSSLFCRAVFDRLLSDSPNRRAAGPDGVPMELIKHLPDEFKTLLFDVFNLQARLHRTCPSWKASETILLYKRGDPALLDNYRPIGLLSAVSKLWTSCLAETLTDFCEHTGILSDSQCGFRPERRTLQHILHLTSVIEDASSNDRDLYILYLDLKDAFGSVDHARLHQVLAKLGIPRDFLSIIKDLYTGRTTCIRTARGTTRPIKCLRGTVQGDCLSPLLFILYLEPLLQWFAAGEDGYTLPNTDFSPSGSVHDITTGPLVDCSDALCADDLALTAQSEKGLLRMIRKVQLYCDWACIEINVGKCAVTGRESSSRANVAATEPLSVRLSRIVINNQNMQYLAPDQSYKYLGIHLSLDLSPSHHFAYLQRQIDELLDSISGAPILDIDMRMVVEELIVSKIDFSLQCGILTSSQIAILNKQVATQLKIHAYRLPKSHSTECLYLASRAGGLCFPNLSDNAISYAALAYELALNDTGRLGRVARSVVSYLFSTCHYDLDCIRAPQRDGASPTQSLWTRRLRLALSNGFGLGRVAPVTAPRPEDKSWHSSVVSSCLALEPNGSKRWDLFKKLTLLRNANVSNFAALEAQQTQRTCQVRPPQFILITRNQLLLKLPSLKHTPQALAAYEFIRKKYGKSPAVRNIWDHPGQGPTSTDGFETRERDARLYKCPEAVLSSRVSASGQHQYLIKWTEDNGPDSRPWWCPSDPSLLRIKAVADFNFQSLMAPPKLGHPLLPFNSASISGRIEISTTPVRPDFDIHPHRPTGRHTLHFHDGMFYFHDEHGALSGAIDESIVNPLWKRFSDARERTVHNRPPDVTTLTAPSQSHNRCTDVGYQATAAQSDRETLEQSFVREVSLLLLRYRNGSSAPNSATKYVELRNHWRTPPPVLTAIQTTFGCYTEMFASPLNVHHASETYFSAFPADAVFGANVDAYSHAWSSLPTAIYFNPEYTSEALLRAVAWAQASAAQTKTPFLAVGVLPKWTSQKFNALIQSGAGQTHILATIPRKFFNFVKASYIPQDPRLCCLNTNDDTIVSNSDAADSSPHAHWPVQIVLFYNAAGLARAQNAGHFSTEHVSQLHGALLDHMQATAPGTTRSEAISHLTFSMPTTGSSPIPTKTHTNWGCKFRRKYFPRNPITLQRDTAMESAPDTSACSGPVVPSRRPCDFAQAGLPLVHDQRQIIFCDASKQDGKDGLGIGVWHEASNLRLSLQADCFTDHITVGELLAILHAVRNPPPDIDAATDLHILTDSLCALQTLARALHRPRHRASSYCDTIAADIIEVAFLRMGRTRFGKVPAHAGVFGNEQADKLAKRALLNESTETYPDLPIPISSTLRFQLCLPSPPADTPADRRFGPLPHTVSAPARPFPDPPNYANNPTPGPDPITRASGLAHAHEENLKRLSALPATTPTAKNARRLAQAALSGTWRPTADLYTVLHERGPNRHWPSRRRATLQVLHGSLPCQRARARWAASSSAPDTPTTASACLLCNSCPDDTYHCALSCAQPTLAALRVNRWKAACNTIISAVQKGDKGGFALLSLAGPHKHASLTAAARTTATTDPTTEDAPPAQSTLPAFLGRLCSTCPRTQTCSCPSGPRAPSLLLVDGWCPPPNSFSRDTNSFSLSSLPSHLLPSPSHPQTGHIKLIPVNIVFCNDAEAEAAVQTCWDSNVGLMRSLRDLGWTVLGHPTDGSTIPSASSSNILTIPIGACGTTFEPSNIVLRALGIPGLASARALQLSLCRGAVSVLSDIVKHKRRLESPILKQSAGPNRTNRRSRRARAGAPDDSRGQGPTRPRPRRTAVDAAAPLQASAQPDVHLSTTAGAQDNNGTALPTAAPLKKRSRKVAGARQPTNPRPTQRQRASPPITRPLASASPSTVDGIAARRVQRGRRDHSTPVPTDRPLPRDAFAVPATSLSAPRRSSRLPAHSNPAPTRPPPRPGEAG